MTAIPLDLWDIVHGLRRLGLDAERLASLPAPVREARLFQYLLRHLPIGIEPGESLAGDFGAAWLDAALADTLRSVAEPDPPAGGGGGAVAEVRALLAERFHCFAGYTLGHVCADYARVVNEGLQGLLAEVDRALGAAEAAKRDTLLAMQIALESVVAWARRYAELARDRAGEESDPARRARYELMADCCGRVPLKPAATFAQALQSVWLVHAAIGLSELTGASISLGRLDQVLSPLYLQDLERGVPAEALQRSLRDFWLKLNRFGDPACALNLGGQDARGGDLYNALSALMVATSRALRLPAPLLVCRVHAGMPDAVWRELTDRRLITMGQPTFYGEASCRALLRRRGVPEDEAQGFVVNSCMGVYLPGAEICDMWAVVATLPLALELAANGGRPFAGKLDIAWGVAPREGYHDFEELYEQFAAYVGALVALLVGWHRQATAEQATERPNPLLSALTRDCVARGKDRAGGGARYHTAVVEGFGWTTCADALTAIRILVFERQECSLEELVSAARQDWRDREALRRLVLACPRYGSAHAEADAMAARVTATFVAAVDASCTPEIRYLPSYHTLNTHIAAGRKIGATLDGRRAGEPLGKNLGPRPGPRRGGLTALLLSASTLDQSALTGGQALDISLDPTLLEDDTGRSALQAALETYFGRGGLEVQVNGVTAGELRAAIADPASHGELLVRVAGYSAPFVSLAPEIQREMVERFEQGL